jgi:putative restriction endonuclease
VLSISEDLEFRELFFAWLRARLMTDPYITREELASVPVGGKIFRVLGPQTGIWRISQLSDSAIGIATSFVADPQKRPYEDGEGHDGLLRYKWRGPDPHHEANVGLRNAMNKGLPLVYDEGVGVKPGTRTQLLKPIFPVHVVAEEPVHEQFAVALQGQKVVPLGEPLEKYEIQVEHNLRLVKERRHQPLFRARVVVAYEEKCAVCRLPFRELLDAAHIKPDSQGGSANVSNGLALCKIHHGAYDADILGISPDYVVKIRESVLETFDGPTLQHALKEMNNEPLRQLPHAKYDKPSKELLAERYEKFQKAS